MVTDIEKAVGVRLTRIGAPQARDIAGGVSQEALKVIKQVPENIRMLFTRQAEEVLNNSKLSTAELLAASFALVSGFTKMSEDRSFLCSTPGYTTLQMTFAETTDNMKVKNKLQLSFGNGSKKVQGLQMSKDGLIAVFDVPCNVAEKFLEDKQIEKCTKLPDLIQQYSGGGGRRRGGRSFRSGSFKKGTFSNLSKLFGK